MSPKKTKKRHTAVPPATLAAAKKSKATEVLRDAAEALVTQTPETKVVRVSVEERIEAAVIAPMAAPIPSGAADSALTTAPATPAAIVADAAPVVPSTPQSIRQSAEMDQNIAALVYGLRDPDADIARDAAIALGQSQSAAAVEPLIETLSNRDGYTHPVVRAAAATSLAQLGDARAIEPLLTAIGDSMSEASAEAIRALATLGDPRAVPALIAVVRNADGFFLSNVRRVAVLALAKLGGPMAVEELRVVAADDTENWLIRDDAAAALKA